MAGREAIVLEIRMSLILFAVYHRCDLPPWLEQWKTEGGFFSPAIIVEKHAGPMFWIGSQLLHCLDAYFERKNESWKFGPANGPAGHPVACLGGGQT